MSTRKPLPPPPLPLTREQLIERETILVDLMYFCRKYLNYKDLNEGLHNAVCKELSRIGEYKTMLFLLPRGHLKSSLITVAWVIQQMLSNVNLNIGLMNANYDKCSEFLSEIKFHLHKPELVALFPDLLEQDMSSGVLKKIGVIWQEGCITLKGRTRGDGYNINCHGSEQGITGKHYDVLVFDDLLDDKNTESPTSVRRIQKTFANALSVLNKKPLGWRIIVGTRWRRDDLYEWIQKTGVHTYTREATEYKVPGDPSTEAPIFPQKFTLQDLEEIRKEQGLVFYSLQYRNKVVAEGSNTFSEGWITFIEKCPREFQRVYILVDSAFTTNYKSDDTAIVVVGQPDDQRQPFVVCSATGGKWTSTKVAQEITARANLALQRSRQVAVFMEAQGSMEMIKKEILQLQIEKGIYFQINELHHLNKAKASRIERMSPWVESSRVVFVQDECNQLIFQLRDYPLTTHDDYLDAFGYFPDVIERGEDARVFEIGASDEEEAEEALGWREM